MSATSTPARRPQMPRLQLGVTLTVGLLLAAILAALLVHQAFRGASTNSTVIGSGVAAAQKRALAPFTSVVLAGSNNVTVEVGRKQSVVVHADNNLLRKVTTRVRSGTLVIGNTTGSFTTKSPMSVKVSVPSLIGFSLVGSGDVAVDGINTPNMTLTLAGSGTFHATGATTRLDVSITGFGDAELQQLVARDAHAVVSGSGTIRLTATNSLDAAILGNGSIVYSGRPVHLTTTISGSGTVTAG